MLHNTFICTLFITIMTAGVAFSLTLLWNTAFQLTFQSSTIELTWGNNRRCSKTLLNSCLIQILKQCVIAYYWRLQKDQGRWCDLLLTPCLPMSSLIFMWQCSCQMKMWQEHSWVPLRWCQWVGCSLLWCPCEVDWGSSSLTSKLTTIHLELNVLMRFFWVNHNAAVSAYFGFLINVTPLKEG